MQNIAKVVDSLEVKLNKIIEHYQLLKSENEILKNKLEVIEKDLYEKKLLLTEQQEEIEALSIAKTIQGSDYSKETTSKINTLIKEIDWCISQLSD